MAQIGRQRTKRTVYEESSRRMLTDARFLFKHGRWHGSVYLAGYAVECKLNGNFGYFYKAFSGVDLRRIS